MAAILERLKNSIPVVKNWGGGRLTWYLLYPKLSVSVLNTLAIFEGLPTSLCVLFLQESSCVLR